MISSTVDIRDNFLKELRKHLKSVTVVDLINKYLGMNARVVDNYVYLDQTQYINDMNLYKYDKEYTIPMPSTVNLRREPPNMANSSLLPVTGKLRYLADRTRPDILVSLGEISTGGTPHPSDQHIKVSRQMHSYLKSTAKDSIKLGGNLPINLFGFSDASHNMAGDSKPRLGGCTYLNNDSGAIHAYSKNATTFPTVSHSACESEIASIDEEIKMIIHIRDILEFLKQNISEPTIIYTDSESGIEILETLKSSNQLKHINTRINFIRECINERIINLAFVPTELNVADTLTKPLPESSFIQHKEKLLSGFNGQDLAEYLKQINNITIITHID